MYLLLFLSISHLLSILHCDGCAKSVFVAMFWQLWGPVSLVYKQIDYDLNRKCVTVSISQTSSTRKA